MAPGQIIAFKGQKGPQAEILPPGFHFRPLLNVLYDVEEKSVIEIKEGFYGFIVAKTANHYAVANFWPMLGQVTRKKRCWKQSIF
jgi:hypothetical protein